MELKQPPYSNEAEQSVIGALLMDNTLIDDIEQAMSVEDIYLRENKELYGIITTVIKEGKTADLITVSDHAAANKLDFDLSYLASVVKNTPSTSNILAYAKIVKDRAKERELISAGNKISSIGFEPGEVEEKLSRAQAIVQGIDNDRSESESNDDVLKELIDDIEFRSDNKGKITGLESGFKDIDNRIFGFEPTDLVIIAARPSHGKSTKGMNIAEYNAVRKNKPFLVCSLEMGKKQLLNRAVCSLGSLDSGHVRRGELKGDDWDKLGAGVQKLKDKPLFIEDSGVHQLDQLIAKIRWYKRKHPDLAGVVVDYIQLIKAPGNNKTEQVSNVSGELKQLCLSLKMPIFALSQLNRSLEGRPNKRPLLSDLRDSGALEQDADIVMFLYIDEKYNPDSPQKGVVEVNTAKFRNGELGTDALSTQLEYCRFTDISRG